jgi:hypothetical protein
MHVPHHARPVEVRESIVDGQIGEVVKSRGHGHGGPQAARRCRRGWEAAAGDTRRGAGGAGGLAGASEQPGEGVGAEARSEKATRGRRGGCRAVASMHLASPTVRRMKCEREAYRASRRLHNVVKRDATTKKEAICARRQSRKSHLRGLLGNRARFQ